MQPQLSFLFPIDFSAQDAIAAVAAYYGVTVAINGEPAIAAPNAQRVIASAAATASTQQSSQAQSPSAPPAPSAPAAPTSANGVQLDKAGLPHDNRIHATPATMTEKGFWRAKRGVGNDAAFVKGVEDELRRIVALTPPATTAQATVGGAPADILESETATNASDYAHRKAIEICGPQCLDDATLNALLSGHSRTLEPAASDWYVAYSAARNKAYKDYVDGKVIPWSQVGQPAAQAPAAPVTTAPAAPQAPAAPANTAPPAPAAPQGPAGTTADQAKTSFPLMVRWITQNKTAGRINDSVVAEVVASFGFADAAGVGSLPLTAQREDFWPHIVDTLMAYGAL